MKVKYLDEKSRKVDEWHTQFYLCPHCGDRNITRASNYCSNCGRKVYRKPKHKGKKK